MNFKKESQKVLVIGNGGREHALIWKIKQSPLLEEIYTNNEHFRNFAKYLVINTEDFSELAFLCKNEEIDVVVVAQEKYLANGIIDVLTAEGIKAFGPSKNATKLESAKSFTKELCDMYGIPTAPYGYFTDKALAKAYIANSNLPIVLKANGLAEGKGVLICKTIEEANVAIDQMLEGMFGTASNSIIIEQFLSGREISYFALIDGKTVLPFAVAKDYKQVIIDGRSANTGGMGAYSPVKLDSKLEKTIMRDIIYPTINALSEINVPYKGILFAGIMLTDKGPKLLEYNVRFGDPETQALLPRLENDLLELIIKTVDGNLRDEEIKFKNNASCCLVLASKGYPIAYNKDFMLPKDNIERAKSTIKDLEIFHAGVAINEQGNMFSAGGRVLNIVATDNNLAECREKIYKAAQIINWQEGFYIDNIGEENN